MIKKILTISASPEAQGGPGNDQEVLPFLGTKRGDWKLRVSQLEVLMPMRGNDDGICRFDDLLLGCATSNGVMCTVLENDDVSPHLQTRQPHGETSRHVYGEKEGNDIATVLAGVNGRQLGLTQLVVRPTIVTEESREVRSKAEYKSGDKKEISIIKLSNGEHYAVADESGASDDKKYVKSGGFVTSADVQAAIGTQEIKPGSAIFIKYQGYDVKHPEMAQQSPSLTIEAATLLSELKAEVIMTNAPSWDQQSEGGLCIVHKILFDSGVKLLVETVRDEHLPDMATGIQFESGGRPSANQDVVELNITYFS